jgi:hypothetical protein
LTTRAMVATQVAGHLLPLGHSARDWSQRALLRTLYERNSERLTSWSVALNPAPLSVVTWHRYGLEAYNVELGEWAARMQAGSTTT